MQTTGQRRILVGQHGHREERGVGGTSLADGEGGNRDALGHLDDGMQRIDTGQRARLHRHAEHRHRRLGGEHARQVGGTASPGDDRLQAARTGGLGVFEEQVGRAVGGNYAGFEGDAEVLEDDGGGLHGRPVGVGPHDDADGNLLFRH